nr:MAG TPA: hypothetical protein [Caudoviricetes sp.]
MPSADSVSTLGRLRIETTKVTSPSHSPARWV